MAVDTAQKRSASASFGFMPSAGTRFPSGSSNAFLRGATLSLYHIESAFFPDPVVGWEIARTDRVFRVGSAGRVWTPGRASRVFVIPEKRL